MAVAARAVVEDGVEERERIGSGGDSMVVVGIVEGCEGCGSGCDLSASGAAACGNPLGIDPEGFCMSSDVTDGGFAIMDAFGRGGAVRFSGPILRGNGNHPALGEVPALGVELGGGSAHPTSAEKENDGWSVGFVGLVARGEDVEVKFDRRFLGVGGGLVEDQFGFDSLLCV